MWPGILGMMRQLGYFGPVQSFTLDPSLFVGCNLSIQGNSNKLLLPLISMRRICPSSKMIPYGRRSIITSTTSSGLRLCVRATWWDCRCDTLCCPCPPPEKNTGTLRIDGTDLLPSSRLAEAVDGKNENNIQLFSRFLRLWLKISNINVRMFHGFILGWIPLVPLYEQI